LDDVFKRVTLKNERVKGVARDLGEHEDPLGKTPFHSLSLSRLLKLILLFLHLSRPTPTHLQFFNP
jgi:hypothetical protein